MIVHVRRGRAEFHIEIFDLARPMASKVSFHPAPSGPTRINRAIAKCTDCRNAIWIKAEDVARGGNARYRGAVAAVDEEVGRDEYAKALAQRSEPVDFLILVEGGNHCPVVICRMNSRSSRVIRGRPGRPRDFQRQ
jgi:hypothetical protein